MLQIPKCYSKVLHDTFKYDLKPSNIDNFERN